MRILLVSQMYPGPTAPDLGVFVRQLELALVGRGHLLERAVLDARSGGKLRYLDLARRARRAARSFHPDVIYAHFLVPTGLAAVAAARERTPLVVTAHGRDVRNVGELPGVSAATDVVVRRAARVIAVSDYLRRELEAKVPAARGKVEVVNCGVDLERFRPHKAEQARRRLGWDGDGPAYLCVGALTKRKNVLRLAAAFDQLGDPTARLAFVGEGPLRGELEQRRRILVAGAVAHEEIPFWLAASDVLCQPSLIEPFGQAVLEAMACERSVVATRVGGPPEFVTSEAGTLVDPLDQDELARALAEAARLPRPNPAARASAKAHDVRRQAERIEAILESAAGEAS